MFCRFLLWTPPAAMQSLYLVHLDRHHLGDKLFLKSLAQHFAKAPAGEPPVLLVHGSGEKVERTLESKGYFPERTDGVLQVETADQRRLVERAVRETNQEIVAALTDEVVSTVGIQGVDRTLLRRGAEEGLRAENASWLVPLIKQRVIPVVSGLVDDGEVEEVWPADVIVALATALADDFDPVACTLSTAERAGLPGPEGVRSTAPVDAVDDEQVSEPSAVRRFVEAGLPTLVTTLGGLLAEEGPTGTQITPSVPSESRDPSAA